jgi:hypothetical protein
LIPCLFPIVWNSALLEVDRFRSLAAIVVLDVERNFLAFV